MKGVNMCPRDNYETQRYFHHQRATIIPRGFRALTMQDSITESKTINYILFMVFTDVAAYLLKKEVEKIGLQVLFRL